MDQQEQEQNVSRRQALKRMAAVGGAVWVAPALQTINMARANAGTPRETCFSVKIEAGNRCEEPTGGSRGFHCIVPVTGSTGGCGHVVPLVTSAGQSWVIDLGSCRFLEGSVKSGSGTCCPLTFSPSTTGVITVPRCATGPHGQLQDISGVELTICCDA
jgi:hypothetical protein